MPLNVFLFSVFEILAKNAGDRPDLKIQNVDLGAQTSPTPPDSTLLNFNCLPFWTFVQALPRFVASLSIFANWTN